MNLKWITSRFVWGGLFILGGFLYLLQNLGLFHFGDLFWALLLGLLGVFFFSFYFTDRNRWWALFPGIILVVLAVNIVLGLIFKGFENTWSGFFFLGGIGLAFVIIYFFNRSFWWAVIPSGVLFTLAIVSVLDSYKVGIDTGGIFLLGLGLTFALLGLVPVREGGQPVYLRWAFIPALVLFIIGAFITASSVSVINYIWPVVLILGGIVMLFTVMRRR